MIDHLRIFHIEWLWPVVIVSSILFIGLVIKEVIRKNKRQVLFRIFFSVLMIATTSFLILQLQVSKHHSYNYVAILTPDFKESQLDSLIALYPKLKKLAISADFPQNITNDAGFILGNGIAIHDLNKMNPSSFQFLSGNPLNGVVKLNYNKSPIEEESIELIGRFHDQTNYSKKIYLELDGIVLDSALLKGKNQAFRLNSKAHSSGDFIYSVVCKDSIGNVITADPLPVTILKKKLKHILFINQFPTFEIKYLKNYLSEEGHQVLVRNELSANKFKFEFYNTQAKSLRYVNTDLLSIIDLVIVDSESLNKLSNSELLALKNAMSKQGLGLFIFPDENYLKRKPSRIWDAFSFIAWPENQALKQYTSIEIAPYKINHGLLTTPLVKSEKGNTIAAANNVGKGKIGTSLIRNSYYLWLSGQKKEYKKLWNEVISAVMSESYDQSVELINSEPVFSSNIPYKLVIDSNKDSSNLTNQLHDFPLVKELYSRKWTTMIWPENHAWNNIAIADTVRTSYFVNDNSWDVMKAFKKRQANSVYFAKQQAIENNIVKENIKWEDANYWLLFCLFILSAGYLWLEPKL
ncbi:hypothetical protein [Fulvivirga sediminis]|uniref:Uncharacterized protein n=1 Tax=Fulvivirga sediminis TaxID=2803949 RepID=A0A937F9X8_9BACT|nr:hypothetical protein [Fulvivirga sediminis]MBL3657314.1 hypothetical protein [Fulvivirga sediminis]